MAIYMISFSSRIIDIFNWEKLTLRFWINFINFILRVCSFSSFLSSAAMHCFTYRLDMVSKSKGLKHFVLLSLEMEKLVVWKLAQYLEEMNGIFKVKFKLKFFNSDFLEFEKWVISVKILKPVYKISLIELYR